MDETHTPQPPGALDGTKLSLELTDVFATVAELTERIAVLEKACAARVTHSTTGCWSSSLRRRCGCVGRRTRGVRGFLRSRRT